jgi:hypothetical protein
MREIDVVGYRLTKYNPIYRDDHGRFAGDEWTRISNIADTIAGQNEYRRIEDAYASAISGFYVKSGGPRLAGC